jgi:hypothetical protein
MFALVEQLLATKSNSLVSIICIVGISLYLGKVVSRSVWDLTKTYLS